MGANLEYFQALDKKTIDRDAVRFLFRLFNFENIFNKKFSSLSLGQMQIVAIIRGTNVRLYLAKKQLTKVAEQI